MESKARLTGTLLKIIAVATILSAQICCQDSSSKYVEVPQKLTVAYTTQPDSGIVHIALAKGYFVEEGLDVQPQMHSFGKSALGSVLENKADLATVAETPVMFAVDKGEEILIVAGIFMSSKNNAIIGRKDRGILQQADLKGKRIGYTSGTTGDFFMDSLLTVNGLGRNMVVPVDMKPDEMINALTAGNVDAVSTWNPNIALLGKELGENAVIFFDQYIYTQSFTIAAQQKFVQNNPGTIKRFLRALIKAEKFIVENAEQAQSLLASSAKVEKELLRKMWSGFRYHVSLDKLLIITLQDEARWAIKNRIVRNNKMLNYRTIIYVEGLSSVSPAAVSIK